MAIKEYKPGTRFPGVIGRTADESEPAWPEPLRARVEVGREAVAEDHEATMRAVMAHQ